jgi:hypothetical protein
MGEDKNHRGGKMEPSITSATFSNVTVTNLTVISGINSLNLNSLAVNSGITAQTFSATSGTVNTFTVISGSSLQSLVGSSGTFTSIVLTSGDLAINQSGGTVDFRTSGLSVTRTITAGNSGAFAPLGFVAIKVSGNIVKIPFFTI